MRVKSSRSTACLLLIDGVFVVLITRLKEGESMTVGEIKGYCKDQVRLVNHSMVHGLVRVGLLICLQLVFVFVSNRSLILRFLGIINSWMSIP